MSYKVKGHPGPHLQNRRFTFDATTGTYFLERTWAGSAKAIEGQSGQFRVQGISHEAMIEDRGNGFSFDRQPLNKEEDLEASVRYEIASEFIEQDIFRHKTVSDDADSFDASLGDGDVTYRKFCEDAVTDHNVGLTAGTVKARVVTHLRKGVPGFEREYIVLRRSRRVGFYGKNPLPVASILDGRFIYTTEQLGIPDAVAFSLPDLGSLPISDWDDVAWGWRRRPSSIVYTGDTIEQASEFILAEWSLLLYEPANGPAGW